MEHYITQIQIKKLLHLSNLNIELNQTMRKNLLITGKNGSGKTTILRALKNYLSGFAYEKLSDGKDMVQSMDFDAIIDQRSKGGLKLREIKYDDFIVDIVDEERNGANRSNEKMQYYLAILKALIGFEAAFNTEDGLKELLKEGRYILAYYGADRRAEIEVQHSIEDVVLSPSYSMDSDPGKILLKYLVHLKTQQAYARNENDMRTVSMVDEWFGRFQGALRVLLDDDSIVLKYAIRQEVQDTSMFTAFKRWVLWDNREQFGDLISFCGL